MTSEPLSFDVESSLWPTPTATPYGSGQNGSPGDGRAYRHPKTPSLSTLARTSGPPDEEGRALVLNPAFVEALMGFPESWTSPD
jgi:hypothetical protein